MTPTGILLLDTSILIHLVRDNWIGRTINSRFRLRTGPEKPLVSILTVGESLAFARKLSWGPAKAAALESLFEDLVVVDLSDEILELYAKVDFFLSRSGQPIGQNDMWIAATAIASGAHLLTTDKDFDPLYPTYLDRTRINPQQPDA